MADINLVRIDFRLIHGQVVTKWVKQANANRIIIVNDMLAKDEFLASVYKMAAPSNVKVDIFTVDDAMAKWTTISSEKVKFCSYLKTLVIYEIFRG